MKKYLKLFMFLTALGLLVSGPIARAEDDGINADVNASATVDVNTDDSTKRESPSRPSLGNTIIRPLLQERREERRDFVAKLKTERDAFKTEVEKEKEAFKTANQERRKEFWNKVGVVVGQRFTVAIAMIEKAQVRVGDIILKLDADGEDTTEIKANLDLSKQKLAEAKAKLAHIRSILPATGEKITAEIFAQIKLDAREAKDLLKEAVQAIRSAIQEIKSLREARTSVEVEGSADANVDSSN